MTEVLNMHEDWNNEALSLELDKDEALKKASNLKKMLLMRGDDK